MTSLKKLKEQQELVLSYWIHLWETTSKSSSLKNRWILNFNKIILDYISPYDEWDPKLHGEYIIVTDNKIHRTSSNHFGSAFGKKVLKPGSGIHIWRFRLHKTSTGNYFNNAIGICREDRVKDSISTFYPGFGFYPVAGRLMIDHTREKYGSYDGKNYGKVCKKNDIIEMIVNMNEYSIKYTINDKNYGYAFEPGEIPKGTYRMGVRIETRDNGLEMIE